MQGSIRFASKFLDCQVDGFFRALEKGIDSGGVASWFAVCVFFLGVAVVLGLVVVLRFAIFFVGLVFFFGWIRSFVPI